MLFPIRLPFLSLCWLAFMGACSPKVSLTVYPTVIAKGDSVFLNWKARGKPTMMVDSRKIARPPFDSTQVMEFTLSVQKGKKEKYAKSQVIVLPANSYDELIFSADSLRGDTLVARGIKDTTAWSRYEIMTLISASKRPLLIRHAGENGMVSDTFATMNWRGLPYAGPWEIKTLLTAEEKSDRSKIPGKLVVKALVTPLKNNDVKPQ